MNARRAMKPSTNRKTNKRMVEWMGGVCVLSAAPLPQASSVPSQSWLNPCGRFPAKKTQSSRRAAEPRRNLLPVAHGASSPRHREELRRSSSGDSATVSAAAQSLNGKSRGRDDLALDGMEVLKRLQGNPRCSTFLLSSFIRTQPSSTTPFHRPFL